MADPAPKRQRTMLSFLGGDLPVQCLELLPTGHVLLHTAVPPSVEQSQHKYVVRTRGLGDVTLLETLSVDQRTVEWTKANLVVSTRRASYLKSHIQKAVRRRKPTEAVEGSWSLLHADALGLWRRLPIIMVEDSKITTDLPFLVFCMLAAGARLWQATDFHVNRMLSIVHHMADTVLVEQLQFQDKPPSISALCKAGTTSTEASIAWTLYLRSLFGGMKCDMRMLNGSIQQYIGTKPINEAGLTGTTADLRWQKVRAVTVSRALVEAVDFHCCPALLDQLAAATQRSSPELRSLMWTHSSGINLRRPDTIPEDPSLYPTTDHTRLARRILEQLFNDE